MGIGDFVEKGKAITSAWFDGDNKSDIEDLSQLSQDEINKLKKYYKMTKSLLDREHVTLHIRKNPNILSSKRSLNIPANQV